MILPFLRQQGIKIVRAAGSVDYRLWGRLPDFVYQGRHGCRLSWSWDGNGRDFVVLCPNHAICDSCFRAAQRSFRFPCTFNMKSKGKEQGRNYFGAMLGFLFLIFVVLAIILILVTSLVTKFLRHGLGLASPELAVQMVWLMIPVVIFSSMGQPVKQY